MFAREAPQLIDGKLKQTSPIDRFGDWYDADKARDAEMYFAKKYRRKVPEQFAAPADREHSIRTDCRRIPWPALTDAERRHLAPAMEAMMDELRHATIRTMPAAYSTEHTGPTASEIAGYAPAVEAQPLDAACAAAELREAHVALDRRGVALAFSPTIRDAEQREDVPPMPPRTSTSELDEPLPSDDDLAYAQLEAIPE